MKAVFPAILLLIGEVALMHAAAAQSLEDLVLEAPTGILRMSYPAREGVCGNGNSNSIYTIGARSDENWTTECEAGPVRVQLDKDASRITRIRTYVGGSWRPRTDVTDLGAVSAREASELLIDLAATASASVAEDALMPAVIADAPDPWQRLLELARDQSLHEDVREAAVFWVGQSAAREATEGLAEIIAGDREPTAVQKAAVFALSRGDDPRRVDYLIRVARTHSNPEVVRATLFWLAESEDERAIDLFEDILTR